MWCKVAQGFWFQQHVADWHYALPRHKCINIVIIPAASVKHTILFPDTLREFALGGISPFFSIWKENKIFHLRSRKKVFLSSWISLFQLKLNRHPVSNQAENFGPAAQFILFRCLLAICKHFWISSGMWALSSLDEVFLNPCFVQMLLQVAGMLQIKLLIFQNHQPLVIVFSSFVNVTSNTYSILLLSDLCPYFFISNSIIVPVSQCAASHFPKKKWVFLKRSLDGYTTAQDFTALLFQTFKPFLSAI